MNVGKAQFLQFFFRIAQHVTKFFIGGKKGFLTDIGDKNSVGRRIENGSESQFGFLKQIDSLLQLSVEVLDISETEFI